MARPYLSIIIPAYNEADRLPKTLLDIDKRLAGAAYSYEILVVNDGSKDNTEEVAKKMAKMIKNLKVVGMPENGGKGATVKQGMLLAAGAIKLFTDADNATSIDQFEKMMPYFKEGADVVIGSRATAGATLDPPEAWYRQVVGKALNVLVQLLLLPGIWDTQCGFKAFTDAAAQRIFAASRITTWGFDVEVLSLARKMGYATQQVPVHWVNDPNSTVHFSAGLQFLRDIITIRWWLWRDEYPIDTAVADPSDRDMPKNK